MLNDQHKQYNFFHPLWIISTTILPQILGLFSFLSICLAINTMQNTPYIFIILSIGIPTGIILLVLTAYSGICWRNNKPLHFIISPIIIICNMTFLFFITMLFANNYIYVPVFIQKHLISNHLRLEHMPLQIVMAVLFYTQKMI